MPFGRFRRRRTNELEIRPGPLPVRPVGDPPPVYSPRVLPTYQQALQAGASYNNRMLFRDGPSTRAILNAGTDTNLNVHFGLPGASNFNSPPRYFNLIDDGSIAATTSDRRVAEQDTERRLFEVRLPTQVQLPNGRTQRVTAQYAGSTTINPITRERNALYATNPTNDRQLDAAMLAKATRLDALRRQDEAERPLRERLEERREIERRSAELRARAEDLERRIQALIESAMMNRPTPEEDQLDEATGGSDGTDL